MISLNLKYRLVGLRNELTEWSELIFWAGIGGALLLSILIAILWAAWHVFWVVVGAA